MKKQTQKLKKVKIDEIIRGNKQPSSGNSSAPGAGRRKPGRPRKHSLDANGSGGGSSINAEGSDINGGAISQGESSSTLDGREVSQNQIPITSGADPIVEVEPIYDTTAEARGLLETPFSLAAFFFQVKELVLAPDEGDALMPSFKPIYDIDIRPKLGEHARYYQFGFALSTILVKKFQLVVELKNAQEKLAKENDRAEKIRQQASGEFRPPVVPSEIAI